MARSDRTARKRHVYKTVQSPVGRLTLVATDEGLAAILWENDRPRRVRLNIEAEEKATLCSSRPNASSRSILRGAGSGLR